MFLTNGLQAQLKQFNRKDKCEIFDDQNYKEISVKICPYNKKNKVVFGKDTDNLGEGYFIINRNVDIQVGDQLIFPLEKCTNNINKIKPHTYTIQEIKPNWLFNRIENYIIRVK